MPIGLATAVTAGAAVLGAGATIYASSQASHAQTKAADQASNTELQVANQNDQLARDMYAQNAARLDPYSSMGLAAGDQYMGMLVGPAPAAGTHAGSGWAPYAGTAATGSATAPGAAASPSSIDQWAQGAIDAMAPNITRSSTWQHAASISDPYEKLQYLLSQSPPSSDQMPLYNAYVSAHPQPSSGALAPFGGASSGGASALAPFASAPATPTGSALAPVANPSGIASQAQQAIAAGANPAAVRARAAQYGVTL